MRVVSDRVVLDLVAGSPADRRGMDYAVLLHLALLCGPCPGPAGNDEAWRSLRPVTGPAVSRTAIALAVLGDGGVPAAQSVGQCLRRLRGAGDKRERRYDPPLLTAVDGRGRHLPPDEAPGGEGYLGYVPLRVLGGPSGPAHSTKKKTADTLDKTGPWLGRVQRSPQETPLDEHYGRVQRPPRKGTREERFAEEAGKQEEPGRRTVSAFSSLRSEKAETGSCEISSEEEEGTVRDRARALGLKPFQALRRAGQVEDAPAWRRDVSFNITNTAMSVAAATTPERSGLASDGPDRKRTFEPWRLAVQRLLDHTPPTPWHQAAAALTALLVEEGPGPTGGPDDPGVHGRADELLRARDRLADGTAPSGAAGAAAQAAAMVALAVDAWRDHHPPLPPIDAGQPDEPPF